MAPKILSLSEDDAELLRWMLADAKGRRQNAANRPYAPIEDHHAQGPEVYVAKVPDAGISARSGTTPGTADCTIYQLVNGVLELAAVQAMPVYNLAATAVSGGLYSVVERDKFGAWFVPPGTTGAFAGITVRDGSGAYSFSGNTGLQFGTSPSIYTLTQSGTVVTVPDATTASGGLITRTTQDLKGSKSTLGNFISRLTSAAADLAYPTSAMLEANVADSALGFLGHGSTVGGLAGGFRWLSGQISPPFDASGLFISKDTWNDLTDGTVQDNLQVSGDSTVAGGTDNTVSVEGVFVIGYSNGTGTRLSYAVGGLSEGSDGVGIIGTSLVGRWGSLLDSGGHPCTIDGFPVYSAGGLNTIYLGGTGTGTGTGTGGSSGSGTGPGSIAVVAITSGTSAGAFVASKSFLGLVATTAGMLRVAVGSFSNSPAVTVTVDGIAMTAGVNGGSFAATGLLTGELMTFYKNVAAGTHDVVVSVTSGTAGLLVQIELITGLPTGAEDAFAQGGGIVGAPTSGATPSTFQANEAATGTVLMQEPGGVFTWTNGFTTDSLDLTDTFSSVAVAMTTASQILSAIGTVNAALTGVTPGWWSAIAATYS